VNMAKAKKHYAQKIKKISKKVNNIFKKMSKKIKKVIKKIDLELNNNYIARLSLIIFTCIFISFISNIVLYKAVCNKIDNYNKIYYNSIKNSNKQQHNNIKIIKYKKKIEKKTIKRSKNSNISSNTFSAKKAEAAEETTVGENELFVFHTDRGRMTLTREQYRKALSAYIYRYLPSAKRKEPGYLNTVVNDYIKLTKYFGDKPNFLLYYVALCSVESNYDTRSSSCAGAQGIPQVIWRIWGRIAEKQWNVNSHQFHNNIYSQLLVGAKVYEVQYKKYKGNFRMAHRGYSGGSSGYHNKVVRRYNELVSFMNANS
jgi:hypothetical protein